MQLTQGLFAGRNGASLASGLQQRHKHRETNSVNQAYHYTERKINNKLIAYNAIVELKIAKEVIFKIKFQPYGL